MTSGIINVTLNRDGPSTPWGFRLHGGKDIGFPLVIQRVFLGSPSEGELQRGDTILQVQGRDAGDLTHMDAYDLIKAAGTRLQLLIRRLPGAPQTPTTPISPLPTTEGMHPYAKLLRETESSRTLPRAPMFQPMSPPRATPQPPHPTYQPIKNYSYSPLPTTPLPDRTPVGGFFTPTPRTLADAELKEYVVEKYKEKEAITHQGYRTLPLIAPKPKTRHDIPMGSYLRHVHDPNWKGRSTVQPSKPVFVNSFPTPTYSTIGTYTAKPKALPPGAPTFERPLDESSQLVHHQYNSPLFLYSQKNVEETIKEQTGVNSPSLTKPKLTVGNPASSTQGPLSPGTPGTLAPAKPGTKLTNIVDITLSPTFQMLQEEEKRRSASPEVRTPTMPRRAPGPAVTEVRGPKPYGFEERINAFGCPKEVIHQSGSFKTLMSALSNPEQA
ncbi:PDZ and LIM domain protein 7-like isoform X1 [Stegodyphus dumicola]|uniref:PDZ and LIM domain protein 7-like isoform X1 n=1 Tax=Stegodyphus dumicola TaxID=202533 RepID=UPI0015B06351|nr:PDZ and LIM domain protein 7-like isoform X1 [Stegodyphus dumicola]